jgi:hypothetical protein
LGIQEQEDVKLPLLTDQLLLLLLLLLQGFGAAVCLLGYSGARGCQAATADAAAAAQAQGRRSANWAPRLQAFYARYVQL